MDQESLNERGQWGQRAQNPARPPLILPGLVMRTQAGTYDFVVQVNGREIPCAATQPSLARRYGAKGVSLHAEGSTVLVYLAHQSAAQGWIIGALPGMQAGDLSSTTESYPIVPALFRESGAGPFADRGLGTILEDGADPTSMPNPTNRPPDAIPGDWGVYNELGVGVGVHGLMTQLKACPRASLELSALDSAVRLRSSYYLHESALGDTHIYADGSRATLEFSGSSIGCEVEGQDTYTGDLTDEEPDDEWTQASKGSEALIPKPRYQHFIGHMADGLQMYMSTPEAGPELYDRESNAFGRSQINIGAGGRTMVTAAEGIHLRRSDQIPIPKRIRAPWDPEGNTPDYGADPTQPKVPYVYDAAYPWGRAVEARDAAAYHLGQMYQRFDEFDSDWHTTDHPDVPALPDEYSGFDKDSVTATPNKDRQCTLDLEPDGSIIWRDHWGSCIYSRGGDIIIAPAGNLYLQTGGSIVALSSDDIVLKAHNSVDVTATEKDVRVSANNNLHLHSDGGVLIESAATVPLAHGFSSDGSGEQIRSQGVVIKAAASSVFVWGNDVVTYADRMSVAATNADTGIAIRTGRQMIDTAQALISTTGDAGVVLQGSMAAVTGGSAMLVSRNSLNLIEGNEVLMPMIRVEIETDIPGEFHTVLSDINGQYREEDEYLGQYGADDRGDIKFTHRSSAEFGTNQASEFGGSKFQLMEVPWQQMARASAPQLAGASYSQWTERTVNDTLPWPGKDQYNASTWAYLKSEQNVTPLGRVKARKTLVGSSPGFSDASFGQYLVLSH